jgi:hypothetical protein
VTGPTCIECSKEARLVGGKEIYPSRPDLYERRFYLCVCGAYCGTHKGTDKPLGFPCGPQTRAVRSRAHEVFDPLWKGRNAPMTRNEAYRWLAGAMGLSRDDCHIGMMDAKTAQRAAYLSYQKRKDMG